MDIQKAEAITKSIESHFKDLGWDKENVSVGMYVTTLVLMSLWFNKSIPIRSKKFPEVLRAIANAYDATGEYED